MAYKRKARKQVHVDVFGDQLVIDLGAKPTEPALRLMRRLHIPIGDDEGEFILNASELDGSIIDAAAHVFREFMFMHGIQPLSNRFDVSEKAKSGDFVRCAWKSVCPQFDCSDLYVDGADEAPYPLKTSLLPHQEDAVQFAQERKVCALFMEMGTGKTRVALELFGRLLRANKVTNCLWLCPCSVRESTRRQLLEHAPTWLVKLIAIAGIESLSSSTETVTKCIDYVKKHDCFLVVDESILIKNYFANRTQAVIAIGDYCEHKVILNGTPITRDAGDLFGQFYALDWRILGFRDADVYERRHIYRPKGSAGCAHVLKKEELLDKAAKFAFTLTKAECLALPKKHHRVVEYDMHPAQRTEYERVQRLWMAPERISRSEEAVFVAFNALQQVASGRKVCSSPDWAFSSAEIQEWQDVRLNALAKAIPFGEQVIVFCRFRSEVEAVARRFGGKFLHGGIPRQQRSRILAEFEAREFDVLAMLKGVGGFGLNLQFCHHVCYFSNDFDLATRLQSEDRCHRIGQMHEVTVTDIVARQSIDGLITNCLSHKKRVSDVVKEAIDTGTVQELTNG